MLELKTEEQKREFDLELARIKARAYAEMNDEDVKTLNKLRHQKSFVYSFVLMVVGTCFGLLLGLTVK